MRCPPTISGNSTPRASTTSSDIGVVVKRDARAGGGSTGFLGSFSARVTGFDGAAIAAVAQSIAATNMTACDLMVFMAPVYSAALADATTLLRSTSTRIAVVGASNNPAKFGNIIVKNLLRHGYTVLPVNLHEASIAGLPAFRSLMDVPKPIDIVDVVTPPVATHQVLKDAAAAGAGLVWLQDGSFDASVIAEAEAAPFRTVQHACIMVIASQARAGRSPSPRAGRS